MWSALCGTTIQLFFQQNAQFIYFEITNGNNGSSFHVAFRGGLNHIRDLGVPCAHWPRGFQIGSSSQMWNRPFHIHNFVVDSGVDGLRIYSWVIQKLKIQLRVIVKRGPSDQGRPERGLGAS